MWHWRLLVLAVLLSGLFIGVARLFLPVVTDYRADIETLAAEILERPVTIERIESGWSGLYPVVTFQGVKVQHPGELGVVNLDSLDVVISIIPSLLSGELRPKAVIISMQEFELSRIAKGAFNFNLGDLAESEDASFGQSQIDWIMNKPDLHLDIERFSFTDETGKIPDIVLSNVDLDFVNQSDGLIARLTTGSSPIAESVNLTISLDTGDLKTENLDAELYLQLEQASLYFWRQALAGFFEMPGTGESDARVWLSIKDGRVVKVTGDVALGNLSYSLPDGGTFSISSMAGKFDWRSSQQGWKLQLAQFFIKRLGRKWPASTFSMEYQSKQTDQYTVTADYLRVQDFLPLISRHPSLPRDIAEQLQSISPAGEIREFKMQLSLEERQLVQYALQARLNNFTINAHNEWPGISGIDGYLAATEKAGMIRLDTTDALFNLPTVFRDPLRIDSLHGDVNWTWLDSGLLIESVQLDANNTHISTQSRLSAHVPVEGPVFLDLQTNFKDGDGAYTSFYLPAYAMGEQALAWLDKGIVAGQIEYGSFILYGLIDDFPFDNNNGRFEVRFKVNNAILDYYKDWPVIDEIEAEVAFVGRSMQIQASSGKIFDADILDTHVAIDDLEHDNPVLTIDGRARAPSADLFRYMVETKLIGEYQQALSAIKLRGENDLDLLLTLPLSKGDTSVTGQVDFRNNQLDIASWGLRLDSIKGALRFADRKFSADNITALFGKQPMSIAVDTRQMSDGPETHIVARSHANLSQLIEPKNKILARQFDGQSPFEVSIVIPNSRPSKLKIHSSLVGTELRFPHPLTKSRDDKLDFTLETGFSGESAENIILSLDDRLSASFDIDAKSHALESAYVQLGRDDVMQHAADRQALMLGGRLDYLDLDAWKYWYQGLGVETSKEDISFAFKTDLTIDRMKYARWFIDNVHVNTSNHEKYWQVDITGKGAQGRATYNYEDSRLDLDFKHLVIFKRPYEPPKDAPAGGVFDTLLPSDVPASNIMIDNLVYADREIGKITLESQPVANSYQLSKAQLDTEETNMIISGSWDFIDDQDGGRHTTDLSVDIESDDFGVLMSRLGYEGTVKGGKSSIRANFKMDRSPLEFDLAALSGDFELSILKGEVVEIKPGGAGRVFGLLSFQTLPRRLALDFRDIFSKGMSFDQIDGSFTISQGQAYTNNLTMTAPSSQVEVSGRVGLKDQDYDQHVRVVPNLSSTLPIAGALAGGPGLAVVMLLTHQLLQEPIDRLTEFEYRVQGPWESPDIQRVGEDKEKIAREESEPVDSTVSDDSL